MPHVVTNDFATIASFLPIFPYAAAHNMRLISLTLRDYSGSSAYTPAEMGSLLSKDVETQRAVTRAHGLEIAAFLKHIITTEKLPTLSEVEGHKVGGVVLLSWSMGNLWSLSLFGNIEHLAEDTKAILQRSLRTLVLHGE